MNNIRTQINTRWAIGLTLLGGLIGGVVIATYLRAAPLKVPKGPPVSTDKPEVQSADYVLGTLTLYTLRNMGGDTNEIPVLLVSAMVNIEVILPNENVVREMKVPGLMYLNEDDFGSFPGAMSMVNRNEGINFYRIDSVDRERGLAQLKAAFKEAYGHEPRSASTDVAAPE